MPEFAVDFADVRPDGSLFVHDTGRRRRPLVQGDRVRCIDARGNSCHGVVSRVDLPTGLLAIALDRESYLSKPH